MRERATYLLTIEGEARHGNQAGPAAEAADTLALDVEQAFRASGAFEPGDTFRVTLVRYTPRVCMLDRVLSWLWGV